MIQIRDAVESDMEAISAVMNEAFAICRKVYRPNPKAIKRAKSQADIRRVVAVEGEKIIGVLRFSEKSGRLHLGLGVHPDHQRKGVARALVEFLAGKALARGITKLSLYTIKETNNVAIFEKLGFSSVSESPADDCISVTGDQLTDVYMEQNLSRSEPVFGRRL